MRRVRWHKLPMLYSNPAPGFFGSATARPIRRWSWKKLSRWAAVLWPDQQVTEGRLSGKTTWLRPGVPRKGKLPARSFVPSIAINPPRRVWSRTSTSSIRNGMPARRISDAGNMRTGSACPRVVTTAASPAGPRTGPPHGGCLPTSRPTKSMWWWSTRSTGWPARRPTSPSWWRSSMPRRYPSCR